MNKKDLISQLEKNDLDQYRTDIIGKLLKDDLNFNVIKNVYNMLNKDHDMIKTFIKLLKDKHLINNLGLDQIENILYRTENDIANKSIKAILNKKKKIEQISTNDIKDSKFIQFQSFLDEEIYSDLYDIKWSGIGRGEILLCLLLKDSIFNSSKRGDIVINNKIVEVKSDNGRLVNQSDFGNGNEVSDYWINEIKKLLNKKDLLKDHSNNTKYSMTRGNNYLSYYVDLLLERKFSIKQIADLICSGWDKMFFNEKMNRSSISKILKDYNGLNGEGFKKYAFEIFLHNMNYYLKHSKIDYIALTSEKGFYLLSKDFFKQDKELLRKFSKDNFIYSYPILTKNASNGRVYSISLKNT